MDVTLIAWSASLLFMMFFAGIEMAFYSASRLNIELKRKQDTVKGNRLGRFIDTPAVFLGVAITGYIIALTIFVLLTAEVAAPVWKQFNISSRGMQIFLEILTSGMGCTVKNKFTMLSQPVGPVKASV